MGRDHPPLIELIHLSDLHFGGQHRFQADPDAEGICSADEGHPSLYDKLVEDLALFESNYQTISDTKPSLLCVLPVILPKPLQIANL